MDGYFRLGMVNQHKHLLKPGDQCIGGGYYHFDFVSNRIILDRESYTTTLTLFPTASSSIGNHMILVDLNGICWRY